MREPTHARIPSRRCSVAWLAVILALLPPGAAATEGDAQGPTACTSSQLCAGDLGYGNVCVEGSCRPYSDDYDLMSALHLGTREKPPVPRSFKLYPAGAPVIVYSPETELGIGLAGMMGVYLGDPETTTISNLNATALYTTLNQVMLLLKSTVMASGDEWVLEGDWRLFLFNQDTYGLGTGTPMVQTGFSIGGLGNTAAIPGAQPMDFDFIRLYETVLKRVVGRLYLGAGYRFDRFYDIRDKLLDLAATPPVVTSHYAYSRYFGFDPGVYNLSGVSLDALYDSRDSTINPYRGVFARLSYVMNPTWLGSDQASTQGLAEFRTYIGLSDEVPRNILALWAMVRGQVSGHLPYMSLPATGWDWRGPSGRGYIQGRFRGTAEAYAEAEWRFRITRNGLLGGVVFLNAQTFSTPQIDVSPYQQAKVNLFEYVKPAGGFGLRFMFNGESRTNFNVDIASGDHSVGIWLGAGEIF
jgi:hypothetical protein